MEISSTIQTLLIEYLLDNAPVMYVECNRSGDIIRANRFFLDLVGPSNRATIHTAFVYFNGRLDLEQLSNATTEEQMLNFNTPSGLPGTLHCQIHAVDDHYLILGKIHTIETCRMQEEVVKLNNELNTLTRELYKKNSELKMLNDQKNKFLGMAAHDLRHPIQAITGFSEVLKRQLSKKLTEEQLEYLGFIENAGDQMLQIVNNFLDAAAIESGTFTIDPHLVKIDEILAFSLRIFRFQAEVKKITLQTEIPGDLPPVRVDPSMIEQVFNNLISNAIKYSKKETTVTIFATAVESRLIVGIRDQGPGIAAEEQKKLFGAFSKLSNRPQPGEKSTGLGLAIAKKIISLHDGEIWVESAPGKGSTFFCSLPLHIVKELTDG